MNLERGRLEDIFSYCSFHWFDLLRALEQNRKMSLSLHILRYTMHRIESVYGSRCQVTWTLSFTRLETAAVVNSSLECNQSEVSQWDHAKGLCIMWKLKIFMWIKCIFSRRNVYYWIVKHVKAKIQDVSILRLLADARLHLIFLSLSLPMDDFCENDCYGADWSDINIFQL